MEAFILDEDQALEKDRQGEFYIMNHIQIHKLKNKPLGLADKEMWWRFFFHIIRLSINAPTSSKLKKDRFDIVKGAFEDIVVYAHTQPKTKGLLFKKPRMHVLSDKRIPFTSFFKLNAYFLFGATEYSEASLQKIRATTIDEYRMCCRLIELSTSFPSGGFPAMRAAYERFLEFSENPQIIRHIYRSLQSVGFKEPSFPLNDLFWAFVMILILADREDTLIEIIEANDRKVVLSTIRDFAEAFAWKSSSENILNRLDEKLQHGVLSSE